MKLSQIYREAAKRMEDRKNSLACYAIVDAGHACAKIYEPAIDLFASYFRPDGVSKEHAWFGESWSGKNQDRRILALCFMAAIAESEGL